MYIYICVCKKKIQISSQHYFQVHLTKRTETNSIKNLPAKNIFFFFFPFFYISFTIIIDICFYYCWNAILRDFFHNKQSKAWIVINFLLLLLLKLIRVWLLIVLVLFTIEQFMLCGTNVCTYACMCVDMHVSLYNTWHVYVCMMYFFLRIFVALTYIPLHLHSR